MLEKIGIAALVVLVASESFAFSEAILWAASAAAHLSTALQNGTFIVAGLIGLACGYWILRSALAHRAD
ncbi:hypothetical protein [Hyphococcus sp.]|uniref:hypothetical protein n=1 Tax=Hyphococcus sp. TaxID=2038636 RepID=UPI0035C7562E